MQEGTYNVFLLPGERLLLLDYLDSIQAPWIPAYSEYIKLLENCRLTNVASVLEISFTSLEARHMQEALFPFLEELSGHDDFKCYMNPIVESLKN